MATTLLHVLNLNTNKILCLVPDNPIPLSPALDPGVRSCSQPFGSRLGLMQLSASAGEAAATIGLHVDKQTRALGMLLWDPLAADEAWQKIVDVHAYMWERNPSRMERVLSSPPELYPWLTLAFSPFLTTTLSPLEMREMITLVSRVAGSVLDHRRQLVSMN